MGKFWALYKQSGGCDYTIACGELLSPLAATTLEDAKTEIQRGLFFYDKEGKDPKSMDALRDIDYDSITIFQGEMVGEFDYKAAVADHKKVAAAHVEAERVAYERREFERLKAKFEQSK